MLAELDAVLYPPSTGRIVRNVESTCRLSGRIFRTTLTGLMERYAFISVYLVIFGTSLETDAFCLANIMQFLCLPNFIIVESACSVLATMMGPYASWILPSILQLQIFYLTALTALLIVPDNKY